MSHYNAETIPDLLGPQGPLSRHMPFHEDRPYQREMTLEVGRLFADGGYLAVEAPTGIGKSLAYGVPAAAWALDGNRPVVVSTYTKALQQQLLETDAPLLSRILPSPPRVRVLKGRGNYLCRRRYESACREASGGTKDLLDRLRSWVEETESGDLATCGERNSQDLRYLYLRITSDARFCAHRDCSAPEGCFYKKARQEAQDADILVVNHALLAVHLFDGGMLPTFDTLVVDEAHAFLPQALDHLGVRVGVQSLSRLRDFSLVESRPLFLRHGEGDSRLRALEASLDGALSLARMAFKPPRGTVDADDRRRFRTESELLELCPRPFDDLLHALGTLQADAGAVARVVRDETGEDNADGLQALSLLERFQDEAATLRLSLQSVLSPRDRDRVYWRQGEGDGTFSLCESPIHLGGTLRGALERGPGSVVFTSATLAAGRDFAHFQRESGLDQELRCTALPSPFDYESHVLAVGVTQGPDPRDPAWAGRTAETVGGLMDTLQRNALVLFTSYRDLRAVEKAMRLRPSDTYHVVAQAPGRSAVSVLNSFTRRSPAVLLGTATFWQGIDLPGDQLEVLVLTRLPFSVPTDPRFQAKSEALQEDGGNPFTDLYVPEAVLRFKQGFGRLIRRTTDRGVVAVLDPRLFTKGYGRRFRESLPIDVERVSNGQALVDRAGSWWKPQELTEVQS